VQCLGGIAGTAIAHLMFDLAPFAIGTTARSGVSQWLAEAVATFTLIVAILGGLRYAPQAIPWLVGLTITAAYWFTSSTSFANPAVTLARGLTTTFAGIAINHVPGFMVAQLIGAAVATLACTVLFPTQQHARLVPLRPASDPAHRIDLCDHLTNKLRGLLDDPRVNFAAPRPLWVNCLRGQFAPPSGTRQQCSGT
jgi:hypothetical protein